MYFILFFTRCGFKIAGQNGGKKKRHEKQFYIHQVRQIVLKFFSIYHQWSGEMHANHNFQILPLSENIVTLQISNENLFYNYFFQTIDI